MRLFDDDVTIIGEIGNRMGMVECLLGLAFLAVQQGQPKTAALLTGAADGLLAALNVPLFAAEQAVYQQTAQAARQQLGDPAWKAAHQAGQTMTLVETIHTALPYANQNLSGTQDRPLQSSQSHHSWK